MDKETCQSIIIQELCELTGLEPEELHEIRELNLFENGILDSLSLIHLIKRLEDHLCWKINITAYQIEDFSTINALIALIEHL